MLTGIDHLGLFIAAGILLKLTPGPDVRYVVSPAPKGGWRTRVVAAGGITAGCFARIGAAALGVSALLAASGTAFSLWTWLGCRRSGLPGLVDAGDCRAGCLRPLDPEFLKLAICYKFNSLRRNQDAGRRPK